MIIFFILLTGAAIASFIGSLSYRAPRNVSIVSPPSFCPVCMQRLKPLELIPVVSYALLRGRCRYCGSRISPRYLILEILVPVVYVVIYLRAGPWHGAVLVSYLMTALIYLSVVDIEQRRLSYYDMLSVYVGAFALVVLAATGSMPHPLSYYLFGLLSAAVLVLLSAGVVYALKKRPPLGVADVLVLPGVAVHFGALEAARVLVFASLTGILAAVSLISLKRLGREYRFPLMPFVAAGVLVEICFFSY
jgi:leader peptidase (prepilin peptidase)/N-methyltransferase